MESKHIVRATSAVAARQRHVDGFEIEAGDLNFVKIFDGMVVGFHR